MLGFAIATFVTLAGGLTAVGVPLVRTLIRLDRLTKDLDPRVRRMAETADELLSNVNGLDGPVEKLLKSTADVAADVSTICATMQLVGVRKRLGEFAGDVADISEDVVHDVKTGFAFLRRPTK